MTSSTNNYSSTQDQLNQLLEENEKLTSQLKEVVKMNTHWQRYDAQREDHVLKLTTTIQDLKYRISDLERQLQESATNNRIEVSKTDKILKRVHLNGESAAEGGARPRELKGPESSYEEQEDKISILTQHIHELKEKNKALEKSKTTKGVHKEDELAILREQINVCVEDFKQERRDRERIHAENGRLKERLAGVETQIMTNEEQVFIYQEQIKRLQERLRHQPSSNGARLSYDEPCCYPEDRPRHMISQSQPRTAHHRPLHYSNDFTELPGDVEIDGDIDEPDAKKGLYPRNIPAETGHKHDKSPHGKEEPLECPRCLASYPISRHADLLTHINVCLI
ncbi:uncharacterized protein [Amphiura filiformis]|uniref:uncharacterized protein n=1 Tax=Amphiura filiformis TaxID=82378 RepID=UPI003B20EE78